MTDVNKTVQDELEDVGGKSIYQSAQFVELEKACLEAQSQSPSDTTKRLASFDERRKKRKEAKRNKARLAKFKLLSRLDDSDSGDAS